MTEEQTMLAAMAGDLFATLGHSATMAQDWQAIKEVELPGLLRAEDAGGFGGNWEDAMLVFRLSGYHALALPMAEAAIAAALAPQRSGRGTIASGSHGTYADGRFSGEITGLCHGEGADYVVAPCPQGGSMVIDLADAQLTHAANIADEPRSRATVEDVAVEKLDRDVFLLGALARVAQIAGALDAALAKSVDYANERKQFGRPLGKFQAVQQNLATFACEAAAANCAAMGVGQAMARGDAQYEIAAAKLRANRAVGIGTALAHQVHGGIGFTHEYTLHPITRRLWAWRSEFGSDAYWGGLLGAQIIARGADNFWADIAAMTD